MKFSCTMCISVFIATAVSGTVSATKSMLQPEHGMHHKPVIKNADDGERALLGKTDVDDGCGQDPNCGKQVNMVLVVNNVLQMASDVEKKAEKADTESKKLIEVVSEVKAAKKAESGAAAAELAAEETVEIAKTKVKIEKLEVKKKEQVIEQQKTAAKAITDPKAKNVVKKDEAELAAEVKEEEIEAKVEEEKEKTVEQAAQIVKMKAKITEVNEKAKVAEFIADLKSAKQAEKQINPQAIYKAQVAIHKVQTAVVKDASTPPAKPTAAEQIKKAELPKVQLAFETINQAKVEAEDAKKEEKKAVELMKEVRNETKLEKQVDKVVAKHGSVKKLEEKMVKCSKCLGEDLVKAPVATMAAAPAAVAAVVKPATIGPKAFLRKDNIKSDCTGPSCSAEINIVLKTNEVLQLAVQVEKKAEKAETESKEMLETVAETKSAKQEEASMAAAQMAVKKKVEVVQDEVKNEVEEIKEKKKAIVEEEKELKTVKSPAAKAVVKKDEAELKAEVKEEKVEAIAKKRELAVAEKAATVAAIAAVASQSNVVAKEEKFKSEAKTLKKEAELFNEQAILKVELEVRDVKETLPPVASAPGPAGPQPVAAAPAAAGPKSVAAEIKEAELPKLKLAMQRITKAKEQAKVAAVEEKVAKKEMKALVAKTEDKADKITANMDTIKNLEKVSNCKPCAKKGKAEEGLVQVEAQDDEECEDECEDP